MGLAERPGALTARGWPSFGKDGAPHRLRPPAVKPLNRPSLPGAGSRDLERLIPTACYKIKADTDPGVRVLQARVSAGRVQPVLQFFCS